jgi:hypothetical protein
MCLPPIKHKANTVKRIIDSLWLTELTLRDVIWNPKVEMGMEPKAHDLAALAWQLEYLARRDCSFDSCQRACSLLLHAPGL